MLQFDWVNITSNYNGGVIAASRSVGTPEKNGREISFRSNTSVLSGRSNIQRTAQFGPFVFRGAKRFVLRNTLQAKESARLLCVAEQHAKQ